MRLTLPLPSLGRRRQSATNGRGNQNVPTNGEGPLFTEDLLARLRRMTVVSSRTIAEGLTGEHRSKRRGSSPEFSDFKSYSQGDDYRRIDWNIYARLDEVFVRLSEITTELTVHVLLDASNSMDWRGEEGLPTKFRYARQIAGALCYVSLWHFDRVVITPFGRELGQSFGPSHGRAHVVPMLTYLTRLEPLGETDLPSALERYVRARRRPGIILLISDLLSGDPGQIEDGLRLLRSRGWQTVVLHVVDEAELSPASVVAGGLGGQAQQTELIEVEIGDRLRLTPTTRVLERYEEAIGAWLAEIEHACNAEHVDYLRLQTNWPVESIVLRLLHGRGLVA
ncbi:MAG: DUF58 domain-containing protein [Thermomicrobiales bacterium]